MVSLRHGRERQYAGHQNSSDPSEFHASLFSLIDGNQLDRLSQSNIAAI